MSEFKERILLDHCLKKSKLELLQSQLKLAITGV